MKRINSNSHIFSNYEISLIEQSFEVIEEVYSSPRKGVPQSQYVIKINEGKFSVMRRMRLFLCPNA